MKKLLLSAILITAIFIVAACSDGQEADVQETPGTSSSQNGENPISPGTDPNTPGNGDDNGNGSEPDSNGDPQAPSAFSFTFRDVVIEMDDNVAYIIEKIGEPSGEFEAPSCAFDGIDRIFSYPGIQIYTYPAGATDQIHTIGFFDDSVRTSEGGIRLGSSVQSLLDAYGDNYSYETGMYKFTRGNTFLEFLTEDGTVIGITYRLDLGL